MDNRILDEVLSRTSLVQLISQYTKVIKTGTAYKAFCPFHNDKKNPSLSISENKGLYHCFTCGKSGNAFRFLMDYKHYTFVEALRELAPIAGVSLENIDTKYHATSDRKTLYDIMQKAMEFFEKNLFDKKNSQSEKALDYFLSRGLTLNTIRTFHLGFSRTNGSNLLEYLRNKGFPDDKIIECSLAIDGDYGKNDRFKNRVMFPIIDITDKVVGFGGRVLEGSVSKAKYINSSENTLYHKGNMLFGLSLARKAIEEEKQVLLVEGYMDTIMLFQHGIRNVVAPLGTAITKEQILVLSRFTRNIVLLLDGDNAGQKAMYRVLDLFAEQNLNVTILTLPDNMDPDEWIQNTSLEKAKEFITQTQKEALIFKLEKLKEKYKEQDQDLLIKEILEYIDLYTSKMKKKALLKKLASLLFIGEYELESELTQINKNKKVYLSPTNDTIEKKKISKRDILEMKVVGALLVYPLFLEKVSFLLDENMFINPICKELYQNIVVDPKALLHYIHTIEKKEFKNILLKIENISNIEAYSIFMNDLYSLHSVIITTEIKELQKELASTQPEEREEKLKLLTIKEQERKEMIRLSVQYYNNE